MKYPTYYINLHANDFPIHMIMKPSKPPIQENIHWGLYGHPDEIVLASTMKYTYTLEMSNWETGDEITLTVEYVTHHYQYSFLVHIKITTGDSILFLGVLWIKEILLN